MAPLALLPDSVSAVLAEVPGSARACLLRLRELIYETAKQDPKIGPLTETLKWGEPAYLTERSGAGTTLRLGWKATDPKHCRLLVNCCTTLVADWSDLYTGALQFDGKRAIIFNHSNPLPEDPVRHCIAVALTYHLRKKSQ